MARNSPDLNPVDYAAWGTLQHSMYCILISSMDDLKDRVRICWESLDKQIINKANLRFVFVLLFFYRTTNNKGYGFIGPPSIILSVTGAILPLYSMFRTVYQQTYDLRYDSVTLW